MQRLFSMFPAGVAGIALLILRLCAAGTILLTAHVDGDFAEAAFRTLPVLVLTIALLLGIFTPITCVLVFLLQAANVRSAYGMPIMDTAIHMLVTASLLMLGPGAYSADARLFGRRLILPPPQ